MHAFAKTLQWMKVRNSHSKLSCLHFFQKNLSAIEIGCQKQFLKNFLQECFFIFFVTHVAHSWALAGPNCIIRRLCHSPIKYVVMTRIRVIWQTLLFHTLLLFLCFLKLCLSHMRLGALQHSLSPDDHSAIWTNCYSLRESMNFASMLNLNSKSWTDFRVRNGGKSESYCEAFVDIPYSVSEAQTPSKQAHK